MKRGGADKPLSRKSIYRSFYFEVLRGCKEGSSLQLKYNKDLRGNLFQFGIKRLIFHIGILRGVKL